MQPRRITCGVVHFKNISHMKYNNGHIAANFKTESENFSGSQVATPQLKGKSTIAREVATGQIKQRAKQPGENLDRVLTDIVKKKQSVIKRYVIEHGEAPDTNVLVMAIQAALIRADEIATASNALDIDDSDALVSIENAEQEAKDISSVDKTPLDAETQAALILLLDRARQRHRMKGGSGKLDDIVNKIRSTSNRGAGLNYGLDLTSALRVLKTNTDTPVQVAKQPSNFTGLYSTPYVAPTTQTAPTTTSTTSSIFNIFDKVLDSISKAGDVIQSTGAKVGGAIGGVQDQINTSASSATSAALKDNLPKIIIGAVVFLILIFIIVKYANKR